MSGAAEKLKSSITSSPYGAGVGALLGYMTAKYFGYDKSLPIISFIVVGMIIGSSLSVKK